MVDFRSDFQRFLARTRYEFNLKILTSVKNTTRNNEN